MTEHSDQLAAQRSLAPRLTAGPLDGFMRQIHAISGPIGQAVNEFVPFPESLPFTVDAKVSDITISASATNRAAVMLRYRTERTHKAVASMYTRAFTDAGVELADPISPTARLAIVRGQRDDTNGGDHAEKATRETDASCRVSIDDHKSSRLVRLAVDYGDFDASALFEKYGDWHHGAAPIADALIDGFEIKTLSNEPRPTFSTLYTTRYRLPNSTVGRARLETEQHLREAGWTWLEPMTNALYLDGPFDAETHIAQDGADILLDFVGEFGPLSYSQTAVGL